MNRSKFYWAFSYFLLLCIVGPSVAALAQSAETRVAEENIVPLAMPARFPSNATRINSTNEQSVSKGWLVPPAFRSPYVFDMADPSSFVESVPQHLPKVAIAGFVAIQQWPVHEQGIEWSELMVDSTRFLLFQHAFRLATEKDTRAGLSGPFFRDYKNAVLNIHGWHDGDPFFVNYIDHPMEGSVAGFLEIAHDSRSRGLEIGKSPEYWKSRMRAMAFSAAFSLQFEIGPVSEASIGNIQSDPKKRGVVDWVITPVVGAGWMIGEDALDKYVVSKLESRTHNHVKRILLRGILNPSRSFANMMQGKVPWHRDTRAGVSEF